MRYREVQRERTRAPYGEDDDSLRLEAQRGDGKHVQIVVRFRSCGLIVALLNNVWLRFYPFQILMDTQQYVNTPHETHHLQVGL